MATKQKEEINPIGVLIVILAGLIAFGAGQSGGGGGTNGQAAAEDPCDNQPSTHVVADWPTRTGSAELKCGDSHEGWEHLRAKDRLKGDRDNILNCIGRTLARSGDPKLLTGPRTIGPRYVYRWKWGTRSGEVAKVWVLRESGSVLSAVPGSGNQVKLWAGCAGR